MIGMYIGTSLIILAMLYLIYGISMGVSYSTHKQMVRTCTRRYGYGTFEDFKREFSKREWRHNSMFHDALFGVSDDYGNRNQLHASIIEFDGKGMIIKNSLDYLQVRLFIAQEVKKARSNNFVDWSNSQNMEVKKIDFQKKIK